MAAPIVCAHHQLSYTRYKKLASTNTFMDTCVTMATSGLRAIGGIVKASKLRICRLPQRPQPSQLVTGRELSNRLTGVSNLYDRSFLRENARFRDNSHHFRMEVCPCTLNSNFSGSSSDSSDCEDIDDEGSESGEEDCARQPQDAVLQAISEVSKMEGRTAKTTNLVIGGTENPADSDWIELDKKVNTYPSFRGFTAIGTGGMDFVQSMVVAVESVLQEPIAKGQVRQRESAQGRYVSVKIGPMRVESSAQVREIYQAMRRDVRMKYFL